MPFSQWWQDFLKSKGVAFAWFVVRRFDDERVPQVAASMTFYDAFGFGARVDGDGRHRFCLPRFRPMVGGICLFYQPHHCAAGRGYGV